MKRTHLELFNFQICSSALSFLDRSTRILWYPRSLELTHLLSHIKQTNKPNPQCSFYFFFPVMGSVWRGEWISDLQRALLVTHGEASGSKCWCERRQEGLEVKGPGVVPRRLTVVVHCLGGQLPLNGQCIISDNSPALGRAQPSL